MLYAADFATTATLLRRAEVEGLTIEDLKRFVSKVDEELGWRAEDVSNQLGAPTVCAGVEALMHGADLGDVSVVAARGLAV